MNIELHYGQGFISLQIPEGNIVQTIRPWSDDETTDNATVIRQTMNCRQVDDFRKNIAGKTVCLLLGDGTRDMPVRDIFGELFVVLKKCSQVDFLICTGTHNADTPENKQLTEQIEDFAESAGLENFRIHVHNCRNDKLINAGTTSRGTQISFNTLADTAEIFLVLSDVKFHYFAGYSNPIKNFMPGICAFETAEQNHSLALNDNSTFAAHPWHTNKKQTNNPLATDQLEGMQLIVNKRKVYALVTISNSGKIQWAQFGPAEKVSSTAFEMVDSKNLHTVNPVSRLIVSPGGLPNDIDLYIAQRAIELTRQAVEDDGQILFLAACPRGIGEEHTMENFYNRLTKPIDRILDSIESEYKLFSHKPYKFARMIKHLRRIWMYSQIDDELIKAAHLHPAHDPQKVVDAWLEENPNVKITIIDGANKIALYGQQ